MVWLRLIRWTNLVIIGLTQLLAWWCVVVPFGDHTADRLLLTPLNFALLALSTVLIAAAGYIINDYFDIRIDAINKPDKVILEKQIPRRMAIIVHSALNFVALLLAALVALQAGRPEWLILQLACSLLLWYYSTTWKRQFMTGNVIVALMTGLTIGALLLYEPVLHGLLSGPPVVITALDGATVLNPVYVLGLYAFFAFTLTWMREIVKDMEDHKGDAEEGCVTMPIRWGLLRSARFTQALSVIAMVPLCLAAIRLFQLDGLRSYLGLYIVAALVLPLAAWTLYLPQKATTRHYHLASRWLKIIMLGGIASLLLYTFEYG